jgi:hypothetical protein
MTESIDWRDSTTGIATERERETTHQQQQQNEEEGKKEKKNNNPIKIK